jgi:hypothetical protein
MAIKVERGIEMKSIKERKNWDEEKAVMGTMRVNDSFVAEQCQQIRNLAKAMSQSLAPKRFVARQDNQGVFRLWRIE